MGNKSQKAVALSITLSLAALALSAYAIVRGFKGGGVSEAEFNTRVEKGIQAYIQRQQQAADTEAPRLAEKVSNTIQGNDATLGKESAPLTLVEFSDYQCPFCERFFTSTLPELKSKFIDTGKVQLVYRDFPLSFHPNARPAAVAAECARDQGGNEAYFKYHDLIFKDQANLDSAALKKRAETLALNTVKFNECLDTQKFSAEVDQDFADGQTAAISGTPGFILLMDKEDSRIKDLKALELIQRGQYVIQYIETEDGERMGLRISGAHPFSTFEKAIQVGL